MTNKIKNQLVEIQVTDISSRGNGKGEFSLEGHEAPFLAEVPFAIPGDAVEARITRKKRGCYQSHLTSLLTPSSERVAPRCAHFGVCGGCRWQQMPYNKQIEYKERIVHNVFSPLLPKGFTINPAIPCTDLYQYRNKMEYTFSMDQAGERYLGLIMDSSRGKVLNLQECHLVNPWFTQTLGAVRNWWFKRDLFAYHLFSDRGSLRTLTLREGMRSGDRMVILTVSGNPDFALSQEDLQSFVDVVRGIAEPKDPEAKLSVFLRIQQVAKGMPTNFYEMALYGPDHLREYLTVQIDPDQAPRQLLFHVSPTAFF